MLEVKSSEIICKGNLEGNFVQVPMDLFSYLELGLISKTDAVVYIKLLDLFNENYGYAYPTISQLRMMTNTRSKSTMDNTLDSLERVGLVKRLNLSGRMNNAYIVYKPLNKNELLQYLPDEVINLHNNFVGRVTNEALNEKEKILVYNESKVYLHQVEILAKQALSKQNSKVEEMTIADNMSYAEWVKTQKS